MDNQPSGQSNPKTFDVVPPGRTPADPTGRPVVPQPSSSQPKTDPMLNVSERPDRVLPQEVNKEVIENKVPIPAHQAQPPKPVISATTSPRISRVFLVVLMCVIVLALTFLGIIIYLHIVY